MSVHDHKPLVTVKSVHDDGDLALYDNGINGHTVHLDLGDEIVTTSNTDLVPLAKAILNAVEPEALVENQPVPERDLAAEVDTLTARVTALEADTEIRVGDTVRVEPQDWNIGGSWVGHEAKTGKVVWVADENYRGRSKYLVLVTHPDGYTNSVYALKAAKVVSRG